MSFDFAMKRGDDAEILVPCSLGGVAFDLTTATAIRAHFKEKPGDAAPLIQKSDGSGITIEGDDDEVAAIAIVPADTAGFTSTKTLYCDVEVTRSDGKVNTVADLSLTVKVDITV